MSMKRLIILGIMKIFSKAKTPEFCNDDWHYKIKKAKYNIKSFFIKRNKQVAYFKKLSEINFVKKIEISKEKTGKSFFPKTNFNKVEFNKVKLNDVIAYNIENARVLLNSNSIYIRKTQTLFYEKWNEDVDDEISDYSSKFIIRHNLSRVRFKHKLSNKKIDNGIFLGCTFSFNYYHFLLELVSRVAYLESIPNSKLIPIILSNEFLKFESFKKLIHVFFKDYTILYLNDDYIYDVENLWYVTSPNITLPNVRFGNKFEVNHTKLNAESILFLKNKCFNFVINYNLEVKTYKKVFIKRKSEIRSYNQDEIEKKAISFGFQSIYFENLSFEGQVLVTQNADYIIGPTGAAWTNLVFAKENAKGLIWMGNNWGNVSMFSTIASIVKFDLNYIIYDCESNNYHEKFILDVNLFEDNLIKLLS